MEIHHPSCTCGNLAHHFLRGQFYFQLFFLGLLFIPRRGGFTFIFLGIDPLFRSRQFYFQLMFLGLLFIPLRGGFTFIFLGIDPFFCLGQFYFQLLLGLLFIHLWGGFTFIFLGINPLFRLGQFYVQLLILTSLPCSVLLYQKLDEFFKYQRASASTM